MRAALEETLVLAAYVGTPADSERSSLRVATWVGLLFDRPSPRFVHAQMLLARRIANSFGGEPAHVVVLNDQSEAYLADRLPLTLRVFCADSARVDRWEERAGLTRRPIS